MRVFVYGTLKSNYENNYLLKESTILKKDYRIDGIGMYNFIKFPFAILEPDSYIIGEIWEINKETESKLDILEGVNEGLYYKYYIEPDMYVYLTTKDVVKKLKPINNGIF
jgi:gamma-glutamylcyclotransferase (GGCT)/AIG2-like uncharacterized protein YtfP